MNPLNNLKKSWNTLKKLPVLRNPKLKSEYDFYLQTLGWALQRRNKTMGVGWDTYYRAMRNVWINACIQTYIDEVINLGFMISSPNNTEVDVVRTDYLTNLFENPMGFSSNDTFSSYQTLLWKSYLGLGDAFSEVIFDDNYNNVPIGLKHIPTELMQYYSETDQWGFIDDSYRFEPSQLIHIKDPDIRGGVWGESKIDILASDIKMEILGRDYTNEILENKGLSPTGTIEYDNTMTDEEWNNEISRLQALATHNRMGTMILRGGRYNQSSISNQDMQYKDLMDDVRDRIIATYGVPPHMVSVVKVTNLGTSTGEIQMKQFKKTFKGKARIFEDSFKKVLGRSTFNESFQYKELDIDDKLVRAQIEDIRLNNGSLSIEEVRAGYGQSPLPQTGSSVRIVRSKSVNDKYKNVLMEHGLIKNYAEVTC